MQPYSDTKQFKTHAAQGHIMDFAHKLEDNSLGGLYIENPTNSYFDTTLKALFNKFEKDCQIFIRTGRGNISKILTALEVNNYKLREILINKIIIYPPDNSEELEEMPKEVSIEVQKYIIRATKENCNKIKINPSIQQIDNDADDDCLTLDNVLMNFEAGKLIMLLEPAKTNLTTKAIHLSKYPELKTFCVFQSNEYCQKMNLFLHRLNPSKQNEIDTQNPID